VYPDFHPRLVLTATLLAVLLFEIVASREAAAFVLSLGSGAPDPGETEPDLEGAAQPR
jgi:hypothetical protein